MYNLRVIKSGARIEIYKINNYVIRKGKKDQGYKIIDDLLKETTEEDKKEKQTKKDRRRSLVDARNNIIRLIKCNSDMNTFVTLTFKEQQDYKESKKSLNILFTKLRKDYTNLKYIWILEYGEKTKRLHYHMLCNIPVEIKLSSSKEKKSTEHKKLEKEFALRYWNYGFIDIRQLEHEGNTNVALYVSTYIVKSLDNLELEGYRVYGYSRKTLDKPVEEKYYTNETMEQILKQFKDYEITFSNSYKIGYQDFNGERKGLVNYFDLKLKGECNYENKE